MEVPFDLEGNLIIVRVENRWRDPLKFVLDTGAELSKIDKNLAQQLGLDVGQISTSSKRTVLARNVQGLKIPGVDLDECPWMEAEDDLAPVDGLIGGDILGRYIVEIDYKQKSVRFLDSRDHQPPAGSNRLGISIFRSQAAIYVGDSTKPKCAINTSRPYVKAEMIVSGSQPHIGNFLVDTGNPPSFVLSEAFTKNSGILKGVRTIPNFCPLAPYGHGECRVGRLDAVSIGDIGLKITSPLVNLYQEPTWEEDRYDGIMGGGVLNRFRVSFDYESNQMILEPNEDFDLPYEFDMSGTFLRPNAEGFELWRLIGDPSDSPAVEAGLKEGDIIIAINGKPHFRFTCDEVDQMFMEDGKEYRLEVSRQDGVFTACIRTRRLI